MCEVIFQLLAEQRCIFWFRGVDRRPISDFGIRPWRRDSLSLREGAVGDQKPRPLAGEALEE